MISAVVFQNIPERLYKNAVLLYIKKGGILVQKGAKTEYAYYIAVSYTHLTAVRGGNESQGVFDIRYFYKKDDL